MLSSYKSASTYTSEIECRHFCGSRQRCLQRCRRTTQHPLTLRKLTFSAVICVERVFSCQKWWAYLHTSLTAYHTLNLRFLSWKMNSFSLPPRTLSVQNHIAVQHTGDLEEIRLLFQIAVRKNQWEVDFLQNDLGLHWLVVWVFSQYLFLVILSVWTSALYHPSASDRVFHYTIKAVDNHNRPWATFHLYRDRDALLTHRATEIVYFGIEVLIFYWCGGFPHNECFDNR